MLRVLLMLAAAVSAAHAQGTAAEPTQQVPVAPLTLLPHSDSSPWLVSGQINSILQGHGAFHSPYEGTNSLRARGEYKVSLVGTLYLGLQPWQMFSHGVAAKRYNTDLILDIESTGGRGISQALGLAGFTNLDVVRNPTLGSRPYIARVGIHQTIGFTNEMVTVQRTPVSLATQVPVRRLELRAGKLSSPDFFDLNSLLSDSHLQFTNWSIDNNGAWDYAADTRGYTYGAVAEYQDRSWAVRYGLMLMPTMANGIDLDWSARRARGQNMEAEVRRGWLPGRSGVSRVLAFVNTAHMGSYREANAAFHSGADSTPDVTRHAHTGAAKYGFGYNFEQSVTGSLTVAGRFGWNDGKTESYAYTEVEQTFTLGAIYTGSQWRRPFDKVGVAVSSNAIKRDHQLYLANGGLGFLLGDGALRYGRETSVEAFYNVHAYRGLYFAPGVTLTNNPGYNQDRGPVWVPSFRAHVDF